MMPTVIHFSKGDLKLVGFRNWNILQKDYCVRDETQHKLKNESLIPLFAFCLTKAAPGINYAFSASGLDYCFSGGRPLGPPRRAPAVDSQVSYEAA